MLSLYTFGVMFSRGFGKKTVELHIKAPKALKSKKKIFLRDFRAIFT